MKEGPPAILKPLIVVLGGVRMRPTDSGVCSRQTAKRRSWPGKVEAMEINRHEKQVISRPAQWRRANRFVKNFNRELSKLTVATPLGRVALGSLKPRLARMREKAMMDAAEHNPHYHEWQVRVEVSWSDLGPDAVNQLLTLMAEDLPPEFLVGHEE